ncbi:MAG: hypothetical protein B7Z73_18160 [Planctomycetia bacterium 21-64-5]|nr:MAG: hypothetical protein B7Z73_18160 [Planctomycetia bacterium 21-64-5]
MLAVLWNSRSTVEPVDFGERIQVTDVWGRVRQVDSGPGDVPTVEVGPLPVFVSGLNEAVTRWRMSLQTSPDRLPSVSGTPHQVRVRWQNHFDQSAGGKLKIVAPDGWRVTPDLIVVEDGLASNAPHIRDLAPKLPANRLQFFDRDLAAVVAVQRNERGNQLCVSKLAMQLRCAAKLAR